jgi:23S rRNA (guanine745-N1)-methyltransferase
MQIVAATNFACPIDKLALQAHGRQFRCAAGHTYDLAREGYCNLLLVQHKSSREPGDSKDMVAARGRFLGEGYFKPIADAVFNAVSYCGVAARGGIVNIVDAGCGEGYFLGRLERLAAASEQATTLALTGIDVSKWAIKAAARRKTAVTWLVANNRSPPFLAGSVDLVLCLFGFPVWQGFKAVQSVGGHVLVVDPGADHLLELREIVYPLVKRSPPRPLPAAKAAGYALVREEALRYRVRLSGTETIRDLLGMTPHAHRVPPGARSVLANVNTLAVTVDVALRLLVLKEEQT